jgi:hypothetical protein
VGKASSQKKVARAATTGGGRTAGVKRPMGWYSVMAVVVALGIFLVAFSRNQELSRGQAATKVAPRINQDHWHSAFSIYICDHFLPNIPLFESSDGIHTHGDGVIHVHPFTPAASGNNATLGFFVKAVPGGFKLSPTELQVPKISGDNNALDAKDWHNGDKCPNGQPGKVKFTVNGKQQNIDPSTWKLRDKDYLDLGFVPDAAPLPSNPAEKQNLANITDVSTGTTTPTTPTTVAGATTPTSGATTPTSVAPAPTTVPASPPTSAAPGTTAAP